MSSTSVRLAALSDRQREVVVLVCRGLSNRLIADTLDVSEGTIKIHLHNIYEIVGVRSRIELMIMMSNRNEVQAAP
jgi:two-component system nitrate/nitrite response regulator NarP